MNKINITSLFSPRTAITSGFIFCITFWCCSFLFPIITGINFLLPYNGRLLVFQYPTRTATWLIICLLIPISIALYFLKSHKSGKINSQYNPLLYIFLPLILLPVSLLLVIFRLQVNQQLVANLLFFIPIFIFAYILFKYLEYSFRHKAKKNINTASIILVGLFFVLFYWLTGWYFTLSCGEHSGDEGHYIIQAKSLYQDHDLELYNNFGEKELELIKKGRKNYLHISPTARDGKFYSWHPFGLPAYLSILPPNNLMWRHLLLGILSGLGTAGLLLLCKYLNVSRQTAIIFVSLFSLSSVWGIYSSRVLPELPGAVFAIWTAVAITSVRKHPWVSGLLLIICCGYLPFLHPRFGPVSIMGYLFFVLYAYRAKQFTQKWPVLIFTTSGLAILAFLYLYVNSQLFTTAIGGYTSGLFHPYLAGMWEVLTTNRSITYIQPSFAWMFTASILLLFTFKENRTYTLFSFSAFFTVLLVACSNSGWTGGASAMGRYLVVVYPLFLPLALYKFERTNRVAKWWFILLAIIPVLHYFFLLIRLPEFRASFGDPRYYIGIVYDYFRGLLDPFPRARTSTLFPFFDKEGFLFPIILFILTFFLISHRQEKRAWALYPVIIILTAVYFHHPDKTIKWDDIDKNGLARIKQNNAIAWMTYDFDQAFIISQEPEKEFSILEVSNRLVRYQGVNLASVTTDPTRKGTIKNLIFQPDMQPNDWNGNPYFWTTLGPRFTTINKKAAFYLTGKLSGNVEAHLLVIEMGGQKNHILLDKKVKTTDDSLDVHETAVLNPTGDGMVHILIRITSGQGSFTSKTIGWSPISSYLLDKSFAYLPSEFTPSADVNVPAQR